MSIKVGLAGVGHLGKIHLNCIQQVPELELIGFYEKDVSLARSIQKETGIRAFEDLPTLLSKVDAIDVVTPTSAHFEVAGMAIKSGKHVFIEKPVTSTMTEAEQLMEWQRESGSVVQIGHVERFNPAMLAIQHMKIDPKFIEVHRLANFNPRGTDVSVVLDLMIHDLDIILSMVPSKVKRVMANGVCLVSETPDIGNARIEWENGCVANVTASRMSFKAMRKMRLFQPDAYIGIDFLDRSAQVITLHDGPMQSDANSVNMFELETARGSKTVQIEIPETEPVNAIEMELSSFAKAINEETSPEVSLEDGYAALSLAFQISDEIDKNLREATK